jgi:hypothetical protein
MAARQALGLCEAELLRLTWDTVDLPNSSRGQPRMRVATTRAALRAAGCRRTSPPHFAVGCA